MNEPEDSKEAAKSAWARIRRNLTIILGERAIFAVVNVIAAGVATRAVGIEAIGAIGLLLAYARLISDGLKFQSWQSVLRFGVPLREADEQQDLRRLIGLTLWIDIGAVAASLALAWAGAVWFGEAMGWSEEMIRYAPWFCIIIAFMTHMTPAGVLRLYDRVPWIAAQHAVTATCRLIGSLGIWYWGGGLFELALVWTFSAVIAGTVIYVSAWVTAVEFRATPRMAGALRGGAEGFRNFWRFITATNFISTLDTVLPFVATLLVGALLGPVEAGIFHLVRQVTEALVRPGDLLAPLFFPELAQMEARGDRCAMRRMVKRALTYSGLILLAVIGALALIGEPLLVFLFGEEARPGYDILILASIASALVVWGFTLEPTLLSAGKAGKALWSVMVAWGVFALLIWALMPEWGLIGIGVAMIGHRGTQFLIRFVMVARMLRRERV
ncbi:MAG: lipopolysaccharide biosynthesis protein [Pseudomonadota bacterium]